MVRLRLAPLAVAACLGLVCGCTCCWQFPLLERFRAHAATDCGDISAVPDGEGPVLEGPLINGGVPGGPGVTTIPSVTPQNTMPPLAPPPRIAPQPQAQPTPYFPQ